MRIGSAAPFFLAASTARATLNLYTVSDTAVGKSFYNVFDFNNIPDPTRGRVTYVDKPTAVANNITYAHADHFVLRADSWTVLNATDPGRMSARLRSKKLYDRHVVVADVRHMPQGCGTWPAIWEFGPDSWPEDGEVDIMEGVNDKGPNASTLHTNETVCTMSGLTQKGTLISTDCDADVNWNQGCAVQHSRAESYGPAFNAAGGGWFVMEKTDEYIKVWFWSRKDKRVPLSVKYGSPVLNPDLWGLPEAWFNNDSCDIALRFKPMNLLINLTLCGDWAGEKNIWAATPCGATWPTCKQYVEENPAAFAEAYFDFKAVRVYEPPKFGAHVDVSLNADVSGATEA